MLIETTLENEEIIELFINSLKNKSTPLRNGNRITTMFILPTNLLHGNGQLNSEIHVGSTPPLNPTDKYWYDTSSGKATLMMSDGSLDINGNKVWKKLFTGIDKSKIEEDKIYDNALSLMNDTSLNTEIGEIKYAFDDKTNSIQEYVYMGNEIGWVSKGYTNTNCKPNYGYGECPDGFIEIPNTQCMGAFQQKDVISGVVEQIRPAKGWCVMKYEPTIVSGVTPTISVGAQNWQDTYDENLNIKVSSKANSQPINFVSNLNAKSICMNHLVDYENKKINGGIPMTYNLFKALAQDVLNVNQNWSGNVIGSGYIYSGHTDNSPAKALITSIDDAQGYYLTGQTSGQQKRTLITSNGETIWDFNGNLWELLYEGHNALNAANSWRNYNAINSSNPFNPNNILDTSGNNYTNTHKIGGTISDNGNASISNLSVDTNIGIYTIIRGAARDSGTIWGGILSSYWEGNSLTKRNNYITIRCIAQKK